MTAKHDSDAETHPDQQTVDGEHRIQLELLDALTAAVRDGRKAGETREVYDRLVDYSRVHFLSEQLLMRLHAYPEYDRHVADHDEMMQALVSFEAALDAKSSDAEQATHEMDRLRAFLLGHIDSRDRELQRHLSASKVGASG